MEAKLKPCHHPTLLQRYFLVFFVPLFRKDWKYFGIILGSFCALLVIALLFIPEDLLKPTGTAFNFFWTFFYNRFWIKDRIFNDGWLPADEESRSLL